MAPSAAAAKACPFSDASVDFHPFDLADPYPFYEWARHQAPVFFSPELNYFVVARYADIRAVFDDWRTFSSENAQAPLRPIGEEARRVMREGGFTAYSGLSARVPPDHTRIRKLVQGCFGVRRFRAIEPQIREIVTKAIDAIIQKGEADFFKELAYDVPALVLFKLVGVPDADVPKVKSWGVSRSLLTWGNLSDQEQVPHAHNMVEYWRYCQDLVRQRREQEGDDLPSDLLREQKNGADISDDEIAGVLYSVLFAGHKDDDHAHGKRAARTARASRQLGGPGRRSVAHPGAVDEVLRYAPSIVAWRRKALMDASIGGVPVPKGSNILLLLGSANRDETMFTDPQLFNIHRKDARKHLAFGYGIHTCVGQQLAKIEFIIALEELARRMPGLRLKPGQKFEFARNSSFRVPTALHVEWKAA